MSFAEYLVQAVLPGLLIGYLILRVVKIGDELDKLNEYLRRPSGVLASEVRITPAVAYSVIEGGKTPVPVALDEQMRNALRFTRR